MEHEIPRVLLGLIVGAGLSMCGKRDAVYSEQSHRRALCLRESLLVQL